MRLNVGFLNDENDGGDEFCLDEGDDLFIIFLGLKEYKDKRWMKILTKKKKKMDEGDEEIDGRR